MTNKRITFQHSVVVTDIALIRGLNGVAGDMAVVASAEVHGSFWFDVADTTTGDDNRTCVVAADGGRWKLVVLDADAVEYQPGSASAYRDGSVGAALAQLEHGSGSQQAQINTLNAAVFSSGGLEDTVAAIHNEIDSSGGLRDAVNYLLSFVAGLLTAAGAWSVGFVTTLTGAVARTLGDRGTDTVSLFDFMTLTQIGSVRLGNLAVDVSTPVQAACINARGKILLAPKGRYRLNTTPILIETLIAGAAAPFMLKGEGFDANNGIQGTSFHNFSGTTDCFQVSNTGDTDTEIVFEDFGVYGLGGGTATAGHGINVINSSNTRIRRVWSSGHGNAGVKFFQAFGSSIDDSYTYGNRVYGIWADQAFNLGNIRRCKSYGNGFVWTKPTANVNISGAGNINHGVNIDGPTDVSYAGSLVPWYAVTPTGIQVGLTSIVVVGGVATATTPAPHGRTTNDNVAVSGATVAPLLNTNYATTITVTDTTHFTFATTAANGTYNEATLRIGPYALGLQMTSTDGAKIGIYSEDCAASAAYIGADVDTFVMEGGYFQGSTGCGLVVLDNCSNGKLGAMKFGGGGAGIVEAQTTRQHGVDVQSSVVMSAGAVLTRSTVYLTDGQYYSAAMPTVGAWVKGTVVRNDNASAGVTPGWYRLTTGSGNVLNTDWRAYPVL